MQPITVSVGGFPAAVTNAIATSQTPGSAGFLTLTASPYTLSPPRRVTITSVGNDTGRTFTVTGTTFAGATIVEAITGANAGTATGSLDFATVVSIAVDAATAGAVTAGYAQSGGSTWVRMDSWAFPQSVIQIDVSGTVTYTVQTTMDDPDSPISPVGIASVTWLSALDTNIVSKSAAASGYLAYTPTFVRIIGSGGTGTATMTIAQFGNVPL